MSSYFELIYLFIILIGGMKVKIAVLDAKTLGEDLSLEPLKNIGECEIFDSTSPVEIKERITDADVVIINKIKLNESNLSDAKNLKLICVAATGYDNIDVEYCRKNNIAVCNVVGYSSHSVAQVTCSMVLSLLTRLNEYMTYVENGEYTRSGIANKLTPVYHEIYGKTWGIIGYGNIGKEVGEVAKALGCNLLVNKRTPVSGCECVDLEFLCKNSDIITIHTPLNSTTRNLIGKEQIMNMKKDVVLVNVSRGAVTDEEAIADAIINKRICAFGTDVYSVEPFPESHPFNKIKELPNVILTPHMAWGSYEARKRCLNEMILNIDAFFRNEIRNRVDLA